MNKKVLLGLLSLTASGVANAGFLIAEGVAPVAAPAPIYYQDSQAQRPQAQPVFGRASITPPQVVLRAAPAAMGDQSIGHIRTFVGHAGRKPAVFGRPVTSAESLTLSSLVATVMPETFQAFATESVDMQMQVKGGAAQDWIESLTTGLRGTPYTATVNWDKHEVSLDVDNSRDVKRDIPVAEKAKQWDVSVSDGLLSQVLSRWCKDSAGECARFVNQSSHDMVIEGDLTVRGDFRTAIEQLMLSVADQAGRVFKWRISPNKILILSDEFKADK